MLQIKNANIFINILYIDENISRSNIIKEKLSNYKINTYHINKIASLNQMKHIGKFDIIISDIVLQNTSLFSFFEEIKNSNFDLPIITFANEAANETLLKVIKLNIDHFLYEPIEYNKVDEIIQNSISNLVQNNLLKLCFEDAMYYVHKKILLSYDNIEKKLTHLEIKLLDLLIENYNNPISKDIIIVSVWDNSEDVTPSAFKNLLNKLRQKIGKDSIELRDSNYLLKTLTL